jgi:serine/threonine protein phosphatase PrpC
VEAPLPDAPSLVLAIDANLAALSDRGRRSRRIGLVNQDAALVARLPDGAAVLAVADGVSMSNHPEEASAAAVRALSAMLEATDGSEPAGDAMRRAIAAAQAAVLAVTVTDFDPTRDPPETTIAAALVRNDRATIGWVGDSRAYLVSGSAGRALTRDDSWLTEIVESGAMSLAAARADRRAHVITQCLGVVGVPLAIHVAEVSLERGAWLVLCTDGLWNYLEDGTDLAGALTAGPKGADALARCRNLALIANEGGGHDNISVALLRVA